MRAFKLTLLVFVLGFGFGDTAHADELAVPPIGGTCVPDSATIRAGHCETAGFGVRFSGDRIQFAGTRKGYSGVKFIGPPARV